MNTKSPKTLITNGPKIRGAYNLSLNIAAKFTQQEWGTSSVFDGVISQDSFKIVIETKLYDNFSRIQLIRHLDALADGHSQNILLTLSKSRITETIRTEIISILRQDAYKEIRFASTTYEDIYQIISLNLSDHDIEMKEVLDDYISLCYENGLTNLGNRTMLAFTARESLNENLRFRIY